MAAFARSVVHGEESIDARAGELLVAEHIANTRAIRQMIDSYFVAVAKASRRKPG